MGEYYQEELLPLALFMGMSPRAFWEEDPALLWSYYLAHRRRIEEEAAAADLEAWLHGSYVYEGVCIALGSAFSGKRRGRAPQYPSRPRTAERALETALTEEEQLRRQQQEMTALIKHQHSRLRSVPKYEIQAKPQDGDTMERGEPS